MPPRLCRLVTTTPGLTAFTRTPFGPSSNAAQRVIWSTAAFETQYASTFGNARVPATLETLTMLPFVAIRCGRHRCVSKKTERRLMCIIRSQSSSVVASSVPFLMIPAELTSTSIRLCFWIVSLAMRSSWFISCMSASCGLIVPSASLAAATNSFNSFSFRPTATTVAPRSANNAAAARPIPLLAPVTITTFPCIKNLSIRIG